MHERYRILGAMLALDDFSVAEIAALAAVGQSTVRTVLRRENDYVEKIGPLPTGRPGGQPFRWRLRPSARESIREVLQELESLGAESWLDDSFALGAATLPLPASATGDSGERAKPAEPAPARVEAAEDAVRRRIPDSLYATNFLISIENPDYPEPTRSYPTAAERDRLLDGNVFVQSGRDRLFGTDGVRGKAGEDLSAPLAVDLAIATAHVLGRPNVGSNRATAVIGRDPSSSGHFLESAIIAGLTSSGVDVIQIGVAPAAAVAFLTALHDAQFGVSLSASHSKAPYNGIKFFGRGGYKLNDSVEDQIERQLKYAVEHESGGEAPVVFGAVRDGSYEIERYIAHVLSAALPADVSKALGDLKVVVDCANGATSAIAPRLLSAAGVDVTAIGVNPDGQNINIGSGSTDTAALSAEVIRRKADLGIAYDGDGDACIAVDHRGRLVDGDKILAALALDFADQGQLAHRTVVTTVMANLGFRLAMQAADIKVVETHVGDRYLADEIRAGDYSLGGTQSGRIIIADHAPGPDGLLVSLYLLAIVARSGKKLAEVTDVMTRHPQVLVNVEILDEETDLISSAGQLVDAVEEAAEGLGERGRIVLRPSGTEPVVRVMVEDEDGDQAKRLAQQLAHTIRDLVSLGRRQGFAENVKQGGDGGPACHLALSDERPHVGQRHPGHSVSFRFVGRLTYIGRPVRPEDGVPRGAQPRRRPDLEQGAKRPRTPPGLFLELTRRRHGRRLAVFNTADRDFPAPGVSNETVPPQQQHLLVAVGSHRASARFRVQQAMLTMLSIGQFDVRNSDIKPVIGI
jgi:phosphoglucosamine mutase